MIKKVPSPTHISLTPHRKTISGIANIPFTVHTSTSFNLASKLKLLELRRKPRGSRPTLNERSPDVNNYDDVELMISVETQLEHWKECCASFEDKDSDSHGWTMCIAGKAAHFGLVELAGAKLASLSEEAGRSVLWINIGDALRKRAYDIDGMLGRDVTPKTVVVSGLRWESPPPKWERAMDLLRSTTAGMDRIVIASGENPLAVMTKLGLPCQRVANLSPYQHEVI